MAKETEKSKTKKPAKKSGGKDIELFKHPIPLTDGDVIVWGKSVKKGEQIKFVGVYVDSKAIESTKKNMADNTLYSFVEFDAKKKRVTQRLCKVWGTAILNRRFPALKSGDLVMITWNGKKKQKGGKTMNLFDTKLIGKVHKKNYEHYLT